MVRRLWMLLSLLLLFAVAAPAQDAPRPRPDASAATVPWQWGVRPWVILGAEDRPALRQKLEEDAYAAWVRLRERSGDRWWNGTVYITWVDDEREFLEHTGHRPEHTAAAANGARRLIWINAGAWQRTPAKQNIETLAHEMGHVLLATLPGSANRMLPLWAEEGIVMHLAGQPASEDPLLLATKRLAGGLPDLDGLEEEFPSGGEARAVAYAVSHSAVAQAARANGDRGREVARLVSILAHPERGPALARDFRDPVRREGWQIAVDEALGNQLALGVIVVTGGTLFWIVVFGLATVAWFKLRARKAEYERREQEEEPWAESLTEADVQDIYGDREDRWDAGKDEGGGTATVPSGKPRRNVPWPEAEDR